MKEKIEKGKKWGRKDRKKKGKEGKKKLIEIMYFPRFITAIAPRKWNLGHFGTITEVAIKGQLSTSLPLSISTLLTVFQVLPQEWKI